MCENYYDVLEVSQLGLAFEFQVEYLHLYKKRLYNLSVEFHLSVPAPLWNDRLGSKQQKAFTL